MIYNITSNSWIPVSHVHDYYQVLQNRNQGMYITSLQ